MKVQIKDGVVDVQGPKGKMTVPRAARNLVRAEGRTLVAKREAEQFRALHGLARALVPTQ